MSRPRRARRGLGAAAILSLLAAGCAVGPNYHQPSAPETPAFKEAAGWRPSAPADGIDKGAWWSMFQDPQLDALERKVATSNQTVKQYEAAYREAHALVQEERAAFFPTVTGALTAQRAHTGSVRTIGSTSGGVTTSGSGGGSGEAATSTSVALLEASWVPDLWGGVRRNVESQKSLAQASAAQLANARLAAQAALAQDYFELRVLDEEARFYRETVAGYEQFLKLTTFQFQEGTQPLSAVVAAKTQLLTAQATLISVGVARAQMEHAIAVLIGQPPATLALSPASLGRCVPVAPAGVPSTLLQRRPDIAAAERQVSAANAQIGVAVAAYFPDLTLTAQRGAPANSVANLFSASQSLWSVGATLSETLLDFGARRARVRATRALYDEDVAAYRQTVLTAFQGVEDQLAALRVLEQQQDVVLQAEAAAQQTVHLDLVEYREGVIDYTTVITAQAAAFAASQNVLNVLLERYRASVLLVEDLGGGWSTADLPKD